MRRVFVVLECAQDDLVGDVSISVGVAASQETARKLVAEAPSIRRLIEVPLGGVMVALNMDTLRDENR